jgi:glycosyltransferase involved in cell wall biosynthesis
MSGAGPAPRMAGGTRTRGAGPGDSPDRPLITVITVVLNGARHLRECIESVLAQTYPNVEHVILDGGSTDGTLEILREYDERIAYWQSGSDEGIYDAMNQGLALATGSIIGIAGSDDALHLDALERVAAAMAAPDVAYTYGAVDVVDDSGRAFGRSFPLDQERFERRPLGDMPFCHLTLFARSAVYEAIGGFDLRYPIRADYDWILRMLERGFRGRRLDGVVGRYRVGGWSDSPATAFETRRLAREHGAPRLRTEWRFLSSLVNVWLVGVLPFGVVRRLKTLLRSRHQYHGRDW